MQLDLGTVASLLGVFTGVITALVKLLLWQFEKRLGERFAAQEEARKDASRHWDENFAKVLDRQDKDAETLAELERSFLRFKADLAIDYVRREDWASGQSVILAKLDGLALRYENILLKGTRHD